MGFVKHRNAYLRDSWNCLDFGIVIISLVGILPGADSEALKALRTARILRPLRSISSLKTMKMLMSTIYKSIPGLLNVCISLTFVFSIFGILGIHTFSGEHYKFCRTTESIIDDGVNPPFWPINQDANWLCSSDEMCSGFPNYLGDKVLAKCGNVYTEYGLDPIDVDQTEDLAIIQYDSSNFNNILESVGTIF